ncbi:MAG TPA: hypothetical protein VFZ59_14025 [Verrucomicrobiae bacterium]|nr:hypothetical protein [Verrucomicrobiae bacterium]
MKTPRNPGLGTIVAFVISYFLPAYGDGSGFTCLRFCGEILSGHDTEILSGAWFYYSGFVIANVGFIGLVVALFVTQGHRRLRSVLAVAFFLHVFSWFVLHLFQNPSQLTELKLGYYVWLGAYGLLFVAHLWKEPIGKLESNASLA